MSDLPVQRNYSRIYLSLVNAVLTTFSLLMFSARYIYYFYFFQGMCLKPGDVAISLGTSDTLFMWLEKHIQLPECWVSVNPLCNDVFMGLLW